MRFENSMCFDAVFCIESQVDSFFMVARSSHDPVAISASTPGGARWGRRRGVGADADTESVADTATSWDVIEGDVVESESNNTRFWCRAVWYLLRLAKQKRHWHAGGTALKFIAERRKKLNEQIVAELRVKAELREKAELAAKAEKDGGVAGGRFREWTGTFRAFLSDGVKSGADGSVAGAGPGGRPSR